MADVALVQIASHDLCATPDDVADAAFMGRKHGLAKGGEAGSAELAKDVRDFDHAGPPSPRSVMTLSKRVRRDFLVGSVGWA